MSKHINLGLAMSIPIISKGHRRYQTDNLDDAYELGWGDLLDILELLALEDAEPVKHGHWAKDRDLIECSWCGYGMHPHYCRFYKGDCVGTGYNEPRYCPNCGAKMDEVSE